MVRAKKRFGQNFLIDKNILRKIIELIPNEIRNRAGQGVGFVEIGAGLGDLTAELLKISSVISYEIDAQLVDILKCKFSDELQNGRLILHNVDALQAWQNGILCDFNYFLVANLPYYVATKIILNAIDDANCLGFLVMVQKEVADKFSAIAGENEFCALSIIAGLQGKCQSLFDVQPSAFNPQPKVISSVLSLQKNTTISAIFQGRVEYDRFKDFLRLSFAQPRRTLLKNLNSIFDKSVLMAIFEKLNLVQNIRPHQLKIDQFIEIFNFLKVYNG